MTETTHDSSITCLRGRAPWTEAETCRAAVLWKAGATALQIAEQLGKTRNAVLGKIGRLGLARAANGQARRPDDRTPAKRRPKRRLHGRACGREWTGERDGKLRYLWQEGLSCDEIAVRLGV